MSDLRGLAYAKVNLALEVLGRRPDGYHEIDTILQQLELADQVEILESSTWAVEVSGPRAQGTPTDDSNLALLAAKRLSERSGRVQPLTIHLQKHIPAAGGLGGGASDAATVLRLLGDHWGDLAGKATVEVANSLGSDEAFFLLGGTARARGRGELLTPLPPLPPHDVVLFVPPRTIERKTARMFAALDAQPFDSPVVSERFAAAPASSVSSAMVFNAFERVAFDLFPWLSALWEDLEARIDEPVRLAGAGPCLFWIGPPDDGARIASRATGAACGIIRTRTVSRA